MTCSALDECHLEGSHASVETTNRYAAVNLEMKRAAIEKAKPLGKVDPALKAWRSDATILEWLEAL